MNLTDRQINMINLLLKEKKHRAVKYYADRLSVSDRTVYSDLEQIELVAEKLGFHIERKKGVGIRATSLAEKRETRNIDELTSTAMYGVKERRNKIFELLLFSGKTITYQNLADTFFVSKSSIHSDLINIKEFYLNSFSVELISDSNGTRFQGSEEQYQNTFVRFNELLKEHEMKLDVLVSEEEQEYSYLGKYYGNELVERCQNAVYDFVTDNLETIAEYYINSILNRLIILVYRSSYGHHMKDNVISLEQTESNILLNKIATSMDIHFSDGDVAYLNKHMEAYKMKERKDEEDHMPIIEIVLYKLSNMIEVDFTNDQQLKQQLTKHFPSMIYRLRNNISTENPFLRQIKHEFGLMYNITWFIMSSLEDELNVLFTDKEIGFLTIYFQSTLDRMRLSNRVLIVCPTGITTSGLLYNRVRRILPPLDMIEVASFDKLKKMNIEKFNLIISTAHIKVKDIPIVVVSPLLSDEDMQKVSNFYNSTFILKEEDDMEDVQNRFNKMKKYINFRHVEFDREYDSSEDLINDVTDRLVAGDFVDEGFKASLLEREKAGGTDLPTGVAVPHGNPQHVKKTVMAIYVNKKPIKWNDENIRVAIFLCIAKKDMNNVKELLGEVYNLTKNRDIVEKMFINSHKDEFVKLLGGDNID
jgi:activator of the mannose operon, transcriptional antiterminator